MSSHDHMGETNQYQPDQPYDQLDIAHKALIEVIAAQARARLLNLPEGAEARVEFLNTIAGTRGSLDDLDFDLLEALGNLAKLPGPDLPPGLPPKLRQAWYG